MRNTKILSVALFIFSLFVLTACHDEDWTGEVRLTNGTTLSCPAGVDFSKDPVSCFQNIKTEDHSPITIPRNQVSEIIVRNTKTLK